jgi:hypothetical protein
VTVSWLKNKVLPFSAVETVSVPSQDLLTVAFCISCPQKSFYLLLLGPGLPDGIFSDQKYQFG